jgi:hypothetical protein
MHKSASPLPLASIGTSGLSLLALLTANAWPIESRRGVVFAVYMTALLGLSLGIAAVVRIRGERTGRSVPASIGIVMGAIVAVWSGLVFWLTTPF